MSPPFSGSKTSLQRVMLLAFFKTLNIFPSDLGNIERSVSSHLGSEKPAPSTFLLSRFYGSRFWKFSSLGERNVIKLNLSFI